MANKNPNEEQKPVLDKGQIDAIIALMKEQMKEVISKNAPDYKLAEISNIFINEKGDMEGIFLSQDGKSYSFICENDTNLKIVLLAGD